MEVAHRILAVVTFAVAIAAGAQAQTVLQDGFESGSFAGAWSKTTGTAIQAGPGATGTAKYAWLALTNNLGARFDAVAAGGAKDFFVDCFVRVTNSALRQFNLHISDSTGSTGSGAPSVNLRYQGKWETYQGSTATWKALTNLTGMTTGAWHRLRVTGLGWGTTNAHFDVAISDAGGTNLTSVETDLRWFQGGNPSNNTARYFDFTTDFGPSSGFGIDEVFSAVTAAAFVESDAITNISGVYPHLAVFSTDGEIGMGAVVPWADKIWFVTYPPHQFLGSPDKLWTIDTNLTLVARPESVGGTHANRLIHRESQQLLIGPYLVDSNAGVRVIAPTSMPGRLTATARHLTDPTNRVYYFTMEDGLYDVDVNSLAVTTVCRDGNVSGTNPLGPYPGTHGKGGYTGQGRVLFANNGESGWNVGSDLKFNGPAGVLTEHAGTNWANPWSTIERKNFTEITGPGGIYGATNDSDAIWSLGWDKRSVILKLLDGGVWSTFRLPKGSYTHDAMHGWYTEWPRIRELTPGLMLMHMHGIFYHFPKTFSGANTAGILPISTFLKMPVDYCWWNNQIVMGRDDTSTTGGNIWAGQSHSAPWFGQVSNIANWGPAAGLGGPWKNDNVTAAVSGDPFLIAGFQKRIVHFSLTATNQVGFALDVDVAGTGVWTNIATINVPTNGYAWYALPPSLGAVWARLTPDRNASNVTAYFHLGNPAASPTPGLFAGLADATTNGAASDGIIRPRGADASTLQFAANILNATGAVGSTAYYEIGGPLKLRLTNNPAAEATLRSTYSLSNASFSVDAASVIYVEGTNRFRLPKSLAAYDSAFASGWPRGAREVVTERQLFNAHGTFYELPYAGSGGFRRIRPVCTHRKRISDFASWRGLFVLTGVTDGATNDGHVFRSDDNTTALWFGDVDDLWHMGAPTGTGGPWMNSSVTNGVASDPYLMFGYDHKELSLSHSNAAPVTFTVEVDIAADGTWNEYGRLTVQPGQVVKHVFPDGYSAHWVRLKSDATTTATTLFSYSTVPAVSGYDMWASAITNGLTNYNESATKDGFPNLLKYATGASPTNSDGLAQMSAKRTGGVLNLEFNHNLSATDLTLVVEGAFSVSNGALWNGVATNVFGSWGGATNIVENTGNIPARVSVSDTEADMTNRFMRLRVARP